MHRRIEGEPTSDLQYALHSLVSAGGDSKNVTYTNESDQLPTIPHAPPVPNTSADPYFEFLQKFLATYGNQTGH